MIAIDQHGTGALTPREPRRSVTLKATLNGGGHDPCEIEIRNLSRRGVGASCRSGELTVGQHVTIHAAALPPVSGVIRWTRGNLFGVMLDQDIDPARFVAADADRPTAVARPGIDLDF